MKGLGFLLVLAVAAPAWAQDFEAAGKHFAQAQELYGKGKYAQAATEFQAAYDITKDPLLLFNMGEAYEKAKDWNNAVKSFRRYIVEAPAAADRPQVEKRLAALEKKHHIKPEKLTPPPEPKKEEV